MVLKFASTPGNVSILEVTREHGVQIKNWLDIRGAKFRDFSKISLRHLNWNRPNSSRSVLEDFIKEFEGAVNWADALADGFADIEQSFLGFEEVALIFKRAGIME